jgi:hypothetical protein
MVVESVSSDRGIVTSAGIGFGNCSAPSDQLERSGGNWEHLHNIYREKNNLLVYHYLFIYLFAHQPSSAEADTINLKHKFNK